MQIPQAYGSRGNTYQVSDGGLPEADCSGSMIPDTNVGGKIATISEVSDDQKTTFLYS